MFLMFIPFLYSFFLYEIPRLLLLFLFFGGAPFSHSLGRLLFLVWLTPSGSLPQITPSWIFPLTWLDLGLDLFSCGRRSLLALDIPNTNLSAKILRYAEILTQVSFKISSKISSKADSVTSFLRVFSYFVKSVKQGDK